MSPVALSDILLVPGERADLLGPFEEDHPLQLVNLAYDRRVPSHSRRKVVLTLDPAGCRPSRIASRISGARQVSGGEPADIGVGHALLLREVGGQIAVHARPVQPAASATESWGIRVAR